MTLICYPKCSTCGKAKAFLDAHEIPYEWRDISTDRPTEEELRVWQKQSGLPLRKFFNTSGLKYRELLLKDRLSSMSEEEQFSLLATDGMLVKRPILVGDTQILLGFREDAWRESLL